MEARNTERTLQAKRKEKAAGLKENAKTAAEGDAAHARGDEDVAADAREREEEQCRLLAEYQTTSKSVSQART